MTRFVRGHLAVTFVLTMVTAWFSYAYFHIDEFFQTIEYARFKLGLVEAWALPWEYRQAMRPWLQPLIYWLPAKVLGLHDVFAIAFAARLVTALANLGALALFIRTALPWFDTDAKKRLFVRVATLTGFLPYLFVRTSSESGSMAALTAGIALVLHGAAGERRSWQLPSRHFFAGGLLLGLAFEMRFQTAIVTTGFGAWLVLVKAKRIPEFAVGFAAALGLGAVADRSGYGAWVFPAWTYLQANVFEGAAGLFGTDPPFAYFWMLPANVFLPVVATLLVVIVIAWRRTPWHPLTWATLPFFVVHNLLAHKEERFLFPIAVLVTGLVPFALASSRVLRVLAVPNFVAMLVLAFYPLGWHHNVRFQRELARRFGDEVHATLTPEVDFTPPAFHARIYDVDKADPDEITRRVRAGTARPWIITERRSLDVPGVTLVYSELDPRLASLVDWYNARAFGPLRRLHYRSLYHVDILAQARTNS